MNSKKYLPLRVFAVFLAGLLVGKFCFSTTREGVGISLFNGKPSKLQAVINLIDNRYVDDIDIDSLTESVIPDIFLKLDPHTKYVSSENRDQSERNIKGRFCGIGVEYSVFNDSIIVLYTVKGGPCQKTGILPGDNIVSADSVELTAENAKTKLPLLITGEKGTPIVLGIKRQGVDSILRFSVVRDDIPLLSVPAAFKRDSVTGVVKITSFGEQTYREFLGKLSFLCSKDGGLKNLIVDLRDNGGGLVYAVRDVISEILSTGDTIVYTVGRSREKESVLLDTVSKPLCAGMRIVCLTNYGTASASEILSGAVQDNDRGLIIGRRTFGKGLVQTPFSLSDNSLVRLTTSRYYTPSGRSFQKSYGDYSSDYTNRLKKGEFDSASAYTGDTLKVFFTKNGRRVYQGGGVMPDLFVPEKNSSKSPLLAKCDKAGLFLKFAARKYNVLFQEDSLAVLQGRFVDTLFSDGKLLSEDFWKFAASCGIETDAKKDKKELAEISGTVLNLIRANACYVTGDWDGYYEYLYLDNPDLDSAATLFADSLRFEKMLKPEK